MSEESSQEAFSNLRNSIKIPFYRIVLTGGPCGGKTTALARLSSYLRERGFEVIMLPEVWTTFRQNGLSLDYFGTEGMDLVIQDTVLDVQMSMEDGLERVLKARGKPGVVLCDRGAMDGSAYMEPERFQSIVRDRNLELSDIRECRYNAVFHMVTAADGAEDFYTLDNNDVRTETPEAAREMDKKTQACWIGHPRLFVLDNSTHFEGKLQRLVEATARLVGLPANLSRSTTKFLLKSLPDPTTFPVEYHTVEVEKVYLVNEDLNDSVTSLSGMYTDEYTFIRKRTQTSKSGNVGSAYGLTTVQKTQDGKIIEKKRIISSREFASSLKQRDLSRHVVKQKRISFLYLHQSFSIHVSYTRLTGKTLCVLR